MPATTLEPACRGLERLIGIAAIDQAASIGERVGQVTNGAPPRLALYLPRLTGEEDEDLQDGSPSKRKARAASAGGRGWVVYLSLDRTLYRKRLL